MFLVVRHILRRPKRQRQKPNPKGGTQTVDKRTQSLDEACRQIDHFPGIEKIRKICKPAEDARKVGIGGAPTRATTLPTDSAGRKECPVASGVLDFFPDAIVAISRLSYRSTQQHHPDAPMHWDRRKSSDEADTMLRHFLQRGTLDTDGIPHSAKVAWRALALLQKELEGNLE